jgi:CBS domain containing-hemolysin-like protein
VCSLVLGFIAEPSVATLLEPLFGRGASVVLALVIVTVLSMVLAELIPKNVAIAKAESTSMSLARPFLAYVTVFGPIIKVLNRAVNGAVRRLGIEPREELSSVRSLEELELLIRSSGEEGTLDPDALTLLNRALRFNDKTAADALVPRLSVRYVHPDDPLSALVAVSQETGFSRFPVCRADLDDVVGVVHVKDVTGVPYERRSTAVVAEVMTDAFVVPETRDLADVLEDLRTGSHLAIVVDEYGGTAGVITLEDVVEELVGDIADEYDPAEPRLTAVLPAGSFELPGTLHPDEVEDACGLVLPDGDYETLAGFVLDRLDRIPNAGDRLVHEGWTIEVAAMDRRRIAMLRLTAPERHPSGAGT